MANLLPPGWEITESIEVLPSLNPGTPYENAYFSRKTYICRDGRGDYICASGDRGDCQTQAQGLAEARTQRQPYNEAI